MVVTIVGGSLLFMSFSPEGYPSCMVANRAAASHVSMNCRLPWAHLVLGRAAFQPAFICAISVSSNFLFFGSTAMFSLPAGSAW